MKWKNFDTVYANGSSLTAGGGIDDSFNKKEYKRKYDIDIDNVKDLTYPKYIADYFGCDLVHDAQSGGGPSRLVRMVYEYIKNVGMVSSNRTLFILEIPEPIHRVDMYIEKIESYVIVNVRYDGYSTNITKIQIQETTAPNGKFYDSDFLHAEFKDEILNYLEKYHNPFVYTEKVVGEVTGLLSFLEKNKFEYYFTFESDTYQNFFSTFYKNISRRNLKFGGFPSINKFCDVKKLTLNDELDGFTKDTHPGYFGNKLYAETIIPILEEKLKPVFYMFGDSHTQTFKSHYESRQGWCVQYVKHLGFTPEHYAELLPKYFDVEVVNGGRGGASNYTIFDTFLNSMNQIKSKDILIFNWTSEGRFRIADDVNQFVDIIPFNPHPKQNENVKKSTTEEIALNRVTYSIWYKEISNFIKIIKTLFPNNQIYHWSWVSPECDYPENLWSTEMLEDNQLCIHVEGYSKLNEKLKSIIQKNADIIYDLSKDVDLEKMLSEINEGKKVIITGLHGSKPECLEFIKDNKIRLKYFDTTDHKQKCYEQMIPFIKYSSIEEETKGAVKDLHIGEEGHRELTKNLISLIEQSIKKPSPRNIMNVPNNYPKEKQRFI
jgi:hypothetical protein